MAIEKDRKEFYVPEDTPNPESLGASPAPAVSETFSDPAIMTRIIRLWRGFDMLAVRKEIETRIAETLGGRAIFSEAASSPEAYAEERCVKATRFFPGIFPQYKGGQQDTREKEKQVHMEEPIKQLLSSFQFAKEPGDREKIESQIQEFYSALTERIEQRVSNKRIAWGNATVGSATSAWLASFIASHSVPALMHGSSVSYAVIPAAVYVSSYLAAKLFLKFPLITIDKPEMYAVPDLLAQRKHIRDLVPSVETEEQKKKTSEILCQCTEYELSRNYSALPTDLNMSMDSLLDLLNANQFFEPGAEKVHVKRMLKALKLFQDRVKWQGKPDELPLDREKLDATLMRFYSQLEIASQHKPFKIE